MRIDIGTTLTLVTASATVSLIVYAPEAPAALEPIQDVDLESFAEESEGLLSVAFQ